MATGRSRMRLILCGIQPYGGFPDGVTVQGGYIIMPELPGIGFEGKADLYREMQALCK